jgi:hypothetical protein
LKVTGCEQRFNLTRSESVTGPAEPLASRFILW